MNLVQKWATEISPGFFWIIRPWRIQIFRSQSRFIRKNQVSRAPQPKEKQDSMERTPTHIYTCRYVRQLSLNNYPQLSPSSDNKACKKWCTQLPSTNCCQYSKRFSTWLFRRQTFLWHKVTKWAYGSWALDWTFTMDLSPSFSQPTLRTCNHSSTAILFILGESPR